MDGSDLLSQHGQVCPVACGTGPDPARALDISSELSGVLPGPRHVTGNPDLVDDLTSRNGREQEGDVAVEVVLQQENDVSLLLSEEGCLAVGSPPE